VRIGAASEYARAGRRFVAALLDVAVVLGLLIAVALAQLVAGAAVAHGDGAARALVHPLMALGIPVAQALAWSLLRGTPGMLLMGCVVLDEATGRRLPIARSALRAVTLWLGLLPLGLGSLWILKDRRRRGWHDIAAGSVVVREDESLVELEELVEDIR